MRTVRSLAPVLAVAATLLLVAGACANEPDSRPAATETPAETPTTDASPEPSPQPKTSNDAITVESPAPGAAVTSPVTVAGNANVFEATVSIRILDSDGEILVETFTTATCGTGCRGTFTEDVSFDVDAEQAGTVMVFESSAEDGRPIHVVRIPVTLQP